MPMSILAKLPKPFFVLAPMDDVTDTVFRQVIADCAPPDLFFTEFVNVDGLQSPGRNHLLRKLQFVAQERPIIAQIWGKDPDNYRKTARELVDMGFAGIDINMGCPVKAVIANGCCSALINNRDLASQIIEATREGAGGRVPVSVKTRVGLNQVDMSWIEFLLGYNLAMLTIHGRTAKQQSAVPADWDLIGQARTMRDALAPDTLLVGNGDVLSRQQGLELAKRYKLDGIMIGRGVFQDPFIFATQSPWESYSKQQRLDLYAKHVKLFADTWTDCDRRIATLGKFCKIYVHGFDSAKELREQLMAAPNIEVLRTLLGPNQQSI